MPSSPLSPPTRRVRSSTVPEVSPSSTPRMACLSLQRFESVGSGGRSRSSTNTSDPRVIERQPSNLSDSSTGSGKWGFMSLERFKSLSERPILANPHLEPVLTEPCDRKSPVFEMSPPSMSPPSLGPMVSPRRRRSLHLKPPNVTSLQATLFSPNSRSVFLSFVSSEHSEENPEFWMSVEAFRANPTVAEARRIFDLYVKQGADKQVNLSDEITSEVAVAMDNIEQCQAISTVFDRAQRAIYGLMELDTWGRFARKHQRSRP